MAATGLVPDKPRGAGYAAESRTVIWGEWSIPRRANSPSDPHPGLTPNLIPLCILV